MKESKFLPSKEKKEFLKLIEKQWGVIPTQLKQAAFFKSEKNKIYMLTKEIDKLELEKFKISSIGLYIAEMKNAQVRLSIEGSQLIGPTATQNVVEITMEELKRWLQGQDLERAGSWEGFVILKHKKDFVGSGKYKEGIIMNYVPKARRLREVV